MQQVAISQAMSCSYHSKNPAGVACHRCARPLCAACDHRVKGFPFCQDCIVAGVEILQQQPDGEAGANVRRRSSPLVATLLSLIMPGLGAAYNGQTSKAVVHFAIFASFFQMAIASDGVPLFVLGFVGTWFFAAVDACRAAQLLRAGLAPQAEEDAIATRLYDNPVAWGITLVTLGALFLLHNLIGRIIPVREILPGVLVALGAYMIFDRVRRRTAKDAPPFDAHKPPPSVVNMPLNTENFRAASLASQIAAPREASHPLPFEPRA